LRVSRGVSGHHLNDSARRLAAPAAEMTSQVVLAVVVFVLRFFVCDDLEAPRDGRKKGTSRRKRCVGRFILMAAQERYNVIQQLLCAAESTTVCFSNF